VKAAIVVALMLVPARALADDATAHEAAHTVALDAPAPLEPMPTSHLHLKKGAGVFTTIDGRRFLVPLDSRVIAPDAWSRFDIETKRLQEAETRLKAENVSLRAAADTWTPGWKTITATLLLGFAGGVYLHRHLTE
jgi:hypothetical protein